ncbi:MAG: type VI secretion system Vgr family protein [Nannocystales bacterium]
MSPLPQIDHMFICDAGPEAGSWSVYRFYLEEAINRPYDATVDLVSHSLDAATDTFLGQSATVEWVREGGVPEVLHGIVVEVDFIGRTEDQVMIRLRLAPAFTLARQNTQHRMFQDMTVLEIVGEVLGDFLGPYGRALDTGTAARGAAARDYCVQYGESDFDFVCRLLEEEGISYIFDHEGDVEKMVLIHENDELLEAMNIDDTSVFPMITTRAGLAELLSVQSFEQKIALVPTASLRQDYDFLTPLEPLTGTEDIEHDEAGFTRRIYDSMRRRYIADDVSDRTTDALQAAQTRANTVRGEGNAHTMRAGKFFELERHHKVDLETKFILTRVVHMSQQPEVIVNVAEGGDESRYRNRIEVQPLELPVRPLQRTPKPRIRGPQTATVCGPAGDEIHTDEHGRIMVQFHWEEEMTFDDTSSCWVRVAQSWAGPSWGTQFIPRIGMEVVVQFLEGNPDRPLVTGCVYNGDNAAPFPLPDNKTQSGWKSNSSPGGGGFNQFRFEDAAGSEEINLHAQKDWNNTVLNCRTTTVGADDTLAVTNNRTKTVDVDQSETVGGNKTIDVTGNHTENVTGTETITITGDAAYTCHANQSITIAKDVTESITGKREQTIAKTSKVTVLLKSEEIVGLQKSVTVGGLYSEKVGASRSITAVGAFSVTAGLSGKFQCAKDITIKAQKKMTIEAGDAMSITATKKTSITAKDDYVLKGDKKLTFDVKTQIAFKCGKASIALKKSGDILIKGKKIQVKGSGDVIVKGSNVKLN